MQKARWAKRSRHSFRGRRAIVFAFAVLFAMTGLGCLTIEQMAPPIDSEFVALSIGARDLSVMETGRTVYLTECARCHGIEPIGRYSVTRWRETLQRMIPKSRIDEAQASALRRYVFFAHGIIERRGAVDRHEGRMKRETLQVAN